MDSHPTICALDSRRRRVFASLLDHICCPLKPIPQPADYGEIQLNLNSSAIFRNPSRNAFSSPHKRFQSQLDDASTRSFSRRCDFLADSSSSPEKTAPESTREFADHLKLVLAESRKYARKMRPHGAAKNMRIIVSQYMKHAVPSRNPVGHMQYGGEKRQPAGTCKDILPDTSSRNDISPEVCYTAGTHRSPSRLAIARRVKCNRSSSISPKLMRRLNRIIYAEEPDKRTIVE